MLVLILLVAGIWWAVYLALPSGVLTVAFLDVGQGDAIFIEAPGGNQLLIDGGRGGQVLAELARLMPWFDRSLDAVMASHPDADHIGGLVSVLNNFHVAYVFDSGGESATQIYQTYRRVIEAQKPTRLVLRRGAKIVLGQGVSFTVLSPSGAAANDQTNETSIIGRLDYGRNSVLLTGDAPGYVENRLIFQGLSSELPAEILKVSHHGSKNSSSPLFIEAVGPRYAVISVGATNPYGHPHPSVLERFKEAGSRILRTDKDGTIIFTGDGVTFRPPETL